MRISWEVFAYCTITLLTTFLKGICCSWPNGAYGVPKPYNGCPGNPDDWVTGTRTQHTEPGSHGSPGNHFAHIPEESSDRVMQTFCMRVLTSPSKYTWKKGQYCIFKANDATCPVGFNEGWVYWDDAASFLFNSHQDTSGVIPDGTYDKNTKIKYCCRVDGSTSQEIELPTDDPFYLLRKGPNCQKVKDMFASVEYVYWKDETIVNLSSHSKISPSVKRFSAKERYTKMFYCYYTKSPPNKRGQGLLLAVYVILGIIVAVIVVTLVICITQRMFLLCPEKKRQTPMAESDADSGAQNNANSEIERGLTVIDTQAGVVSYSVSPQDNGFGRDINNQNLPETSAGLPDQPPSYEETTTPVHKKQLMLSNQLFSPDNDENQPMLAVGGPPQMRGGGDDRLLNPRVLASPPSYEEALHDPVET